ncbi:MAG: oligoendopeptidase F [bacterium]|nr:oligoendopeptidase F [bacterium]
MKNHGLTLFSPSELATATKRDTIAESDKWDLRHIYGNWSAWETDRDRLRELIGRFADLEGTLSEGATQLLNACLLHDKLGQLAYTVYQYPALSSAEDTRDNQAQARLQEVEIALAQFRQATAWYKPELLLIPWATISDWIDMTPDLEPHHFGISELFRLREHTLDEAGERLLAYSQSFNRTPSSTYSMLADADVDFPSVALSTGETVVASHATYMNGLRSKQIKADREALTHAHFSVYDNNANTYAAMYNGVLQRDWALAQARGYASCLEAELDEDSVPITVVDDLIAKAKAGSGPLRRYHLLRRNVLGLERYHYYDAYLPIVESDWPFPYGEVRNVVVDSVQIFGSDYRTTVERAFDERWIDVYETEGKRSGAFSAGVYGIHPYMLLNYADTLNDAFTVAHEMGHTMHTVLSEEHQPFATSSYSIFVAEVASMTNEALLLDRLLLQEDDSQRRIVLLQHAIDDVAASFYRQAMFADFEFNAHRAVESGKPITATVLQKLYLETLDAFFGDSLDDHELYRNTWAQIPHFFHSPFYVYQYATSKAAASLVHQAMTNGSTEERSATVKRYLDLLASGGNDHPISQLKKAGVDFSTPTPVNALVDTMEELVSKLEQELES